MQLESLILHLQEKLNEHRSNAQKPQAVDLQRRTYYLNLEADYTFRQLEKVIAELKGNSATYNGKTEITADHVKIITKFLAARWDRIKGTDAIYSISVLNSANVLCRELANYLSVQLRKLSGEKNENALLMPTIKSWKNPGHRSADMSVMSPHRFLPTDDNLYCMQILHARETLGSNDIELWNRENSEHHRKLTPAEFKRVYNHSMPVKKYYDEVKALLQRYHQSTCQKDIDAANVKLQDDLMRDDYIKNMSTITATYGIPGEDLLKENLLKEIKNGLFADREQLFDYMAGKVEQSKWYDFLKKFGIEKPVSADKQEVNEEFEKFRALICEGEDIKTTLRSTSMYNQNYLHDMSVVLCKAITYINIREPQGEAGFISSLLGGDKLSAKRQAIDEIKHAVLDNRHKGDWDDYASRHAPDVTRAMTRGKVGYIFAQAKEIEARKLAEKSVNKPARLGVK